MFKLSRVSSASTGVSLREPEHGMDGLTIVNGRPEVCKWLRKGLRSCGKSAATTTAGVKDEHGGQNVPGTLQYDEILKELEGGRIEVKKNDEKY